MIEKFRDATTDLSLLLCAEKPTALKAVPLGSTVTLKCPDGQRLFGNMESKCVKGIWKPLLGTCVDDKRILSY
uniref:Sushi domain-containing protein n=1 Tax=Elaeophora elaphi TaxID=1147741 RepID=A0A0R3RKD4_9BILA